MKNKDGTPRMPEVGEYVRGLGRLVSLEDVTPEIKPMTGYIFEDLSATVEMWMNGKKLKECVTFNDIYGFESCIKAALEEVSDLKEQYGDGMEFKIIKHTDYGCMMPWHEGSNFYDSDFKQFKEMGAFHNGSIYNRLKVPQSKHEEHWSSKTGFISSQEGEKA